MTTDMPDRGVITDTLIDHLEQHAAITGAGIVVGDGTRPPQAGWEGTQPGQGGFTPSTQVDTLAGTPQMREAINSRHSSWALSYRLSTIGATRQHADDRAGKVRAAALELPHGTASSDICPGWRLTDVVFAQQAPVEKQAPTDHPTFKIDDVVTLWVDRRRSP